MMEQSTACQVLLRPLCGSEEHFENRKLSLEQGRPVARRTTITINLHPIILSFTEHTHLAQTPPRTFHLLPVYTPFSLSSSPPIWQCQPLHLPSFFLSFLPSVPIHLHCQHSISLVRLSCQDEWQHWPPGTCCFINMVDSSASAVWPQKQLQYVAGRFSLPLNTKLLEDSCRVDTTSSTTTPSGACIFSSNDTQLLKICKSLCILLNIIKILSG